jgi:CRP-like cAMP-binding protein
MMEVLASRTQQMLEAVESLTLLSGSQRTVRYLLEQVKEIEGGGAQVSITLPTTKGVLASHLNLSPEYFSRLLMELQASGLIRVSGRRIDIPNIDRMRECI